MILTADTLKQIYINAFPGTIDKYTNLIDETMRNCDITTPLRVAHFLAQIGHESGELHYTAENLNYSAEALLRVFPSHFTSDIVDQYARQPEKIANRVYANRMGNGNEASGDGWKYKGRGLIQITGKDNYTKCALGINRPYLITESSYLETPLGACESATWFWKDRRLNTLADTDNIIGITKIINGGTNGLDDRTRILNLAKKIMDI